MYVREQKEKKRKRKDDVKLRDRGAAVVLRFHFLLFSSSHIPLHTQESKRERIVRNSPSQIAPCEG